MAVNAAYNIGQFWNIGQEVERLETTKIPLLEHIFGAEEYELKAINELQALMLGIRVDGYKSQSNLDAMQANAANMDKEFSRALALLNSPSDAALKTKVRDLQETTRSQWDSLAKLISAESAISLNETYWADLQEGVASGKATGEEIANMLKQVELNVEQAVADIEQHEKDAMSSSIVIFLVAVLISVALWLMLSGSIKRRFDHSMSSINTISEGDLTVQVDTSGKDELAQMNQTMQGMADFLRGLVSTIRESSQNLQHTSSEMLDTSQTNLQSVETQKAELEMLSSSTSQMSQAALEIAQNVERTTGASEQANAMTNAALQRVLGVKVSVSDLSESLNQACATINRVNRDTEEVYKVLDVIREVAEQTNLLALNAAIEAARAGEHGRGFAVVADEVRTLASRTQASTKEIADTIHSLREASQLAVTAMEEGRKRSDELVTSSEESSQMLQEVTDNVAQILESNSGIAAATEEQSVASNEIADNATRIDEAGGRIEASGKTTVMKAEELIQVSGELSDLIERFNT